VGPEKDRTLRGKHGNYKLLKKTVKADSKHTKTVRVQMTLLFAILSVAIPSAFFSGLFLAA